MSEDSITLCDLLSLSIGTPQKGSVNFSALHALLSAVLKQLDIREVKTRWRDSPPGDRHRDAPVDVPAPVEEGQLQVQRDTSALEERAASPPSPTLTSGSAADSGGRIWSRIQGCEDGVSQAMALIQELHDQRDGLSDEVEKLRHQQTLLAAQTETATAVEKCCHRVDGLEETVGSLRDTFQKYPDLQELSQFVTWEAMKSALLSKGENLQTDLVNSGVDQVKPTNTPLSSTLTERSHTSPPSSPHPAAAAPTSPTVLQESADAKENSPSGTKTGPTAADLHQAPEASSSDCYSETVEALRNLGKLQQLEARVAALEEGKVDHTQLAHLKELVTNKGSRDASNNLKDQLNQQRALIDSLMSDREKLDKLEDMLMNLTSQEREPASEAASESPDSDSKASRELRQQVSYLRKSVQKLEEAVKQLKAKQALSEERAADQHLQDQSVELGNGVQKAIQQLQADCEKLHKTTRCLHQDNQQKQSHIEVLYKTTQELQVKKADKQMVESEIKADKSSLDSKVSRLQFDSVTEQLNSMFHELLNKVTGQEQDWHKVVDRLSTEMECKLNRIELDSVKRQLEVRWKNIHEKLQAQGAPEHEDAAAFRKQLVERFHCLSCNRPIVKHTPGPLLATLPSTPAFPSHKSIRPFTVYALEQLRQHYRSMKPGTNRSNFEVAHPGRRREQLWRSHAEMVRQIESLERHRAGTQDSLNQSPAGVQHERMSELTDYGHLAMSRNCGGSHTNTSASQRRSGLQHVKHPAQPEADGVIQSEEVDIVGLDGHIYKGRLNRNTETKLPTISSKDGTCKTKDKARCSAPQKPATSPELGLPLHHPHSAKSAQSSRSASSCSGRDWPVSALGCASQSSVTPASGAAESNTEPPSDEPLNM